MRRSPRRRLRALTLRRGSAAVILSVVLLAFSAVAASADETVYACQGNTVSPFSPSNADGGLFTMPDYCPVSVTTTGGSMSQGTSASWAATAPAGLTITKVQVLAMAERDVNAGSAGEYGGGFFWDNGGGDQISPNETSFTTPPWFSSSTFGFFIVCGQTQCAQEGGNISVSSAVFTVHEAAPPVLQEPQLPTVPQLWGETSWVRGDWPLMWFGQSASGVCSVSATLAGVLLPGERMAPDQTRWQQCYYPTTWTGDTVATGGYPNGNDPLEIFATDAANETTSAVETVHIDNEQPAVALTGPTDAPSSAGTQYVTATASAGPSGIDGISCTVDGGPGQWYQAATAQVPIPDIIGSHTVQCSSENNAVDPQGNHATSPVQSLVMKIGTPTVAALGFSRLVDRLRCHHTFERVRIPGRWVNVSVGGHEVRIHERARWQRIRITHCHVRIVRRRVTVWRTVRRHGRRMRVRRSKVIRVLLYPHVVTESTRLVRHGRGTTVDGWLGTSSGVALVHRIVEILTAADNGRHNYHLAGTAETGADGSWSATIGPGPSRLIKVSYPGDFTTEATESAPVTVLVPAKITILKITPNHVAWGQTVRITGRLAGGYFPPGGALVRLRIGLRSAVTTYGVREHVGGHHGLFSTTYTFGAGDPAFYRQFFFQVATLPMGDYPYAPATSNRITVTVGGAPVRESRPRHHRHRHRKRPK